MNKIKTYKIFDVSKKPTMDYYTNSLRESADTDDKFPFYYLKPTKQIISGNEILELIIKDDLTNFKNDFKGWLKISPKYRNFLFNVTMLKMDKLYGNNVVHFTIDRYFDDTGQYHRADTNISIIIIGKIEIQKYIIVEPTKNAKSIIDPFDEEDWDWDLF
jgi:hypothetical protein